MEEVAGVATSIKSQISSECQKRKFQTFESRLNLMNSLEVKIYHTLHSRYAHVNAGCGQKAQK